MKPEKPSPLPSANSGALPSFRLNQQQEESNVPPLKAAQPGQPCPRCHQGIMDYDGLLNLVCPVCHYVEGGGCT